MNPTNKVPVKLYDAEENAVYTVYLEPTEAKICGTDLAFAQEILEDARVPARVISQTDQVMGNSVSDLENTELSSENTEIDSQIVESSAWSYNETLALINAYDNHKENFNIVKKRKTVWVDISNELLSRGFSKSDSKCETKWKNLVRTYKNVKDIKKRSGRGSSRFLFFDRLDEILGDKPSISSIHTFSTTEIDSLTSDTAGTSETHSEGGREDMNSRKDQEENESQNEKKKGRNTLKRKTEELIDIKISYFKRRQEERDTKDKRKEEKIALQKRLVEIEEKKIGLLERYVNSRV